MHKVFIIALIFNILGLSVQAQEIEKVETESKIFDQLFSEKDPEAEIRIVQEEKLDEIMMMFMEENRKLKGIPCYWIRIYSGSGHDARQKAYEAKGKFMSKYDTIRNLVRHDDPNFKVYIGGYRSKSETLKLLNTIKKERDFRTAFIVYDVIDFPEK